MSDLNPFAAFLHSLAHILGLLNVREKLEVYTDWSGQSWTYIKCPVCGLTRDHEKIPLWPYEDDELWR